MHHSRHHEAFNSLELQALAKLEHLPYYRGAWLRDEFLDMGRKGQIKPGGYILNLGSTKMGNGTHWCAFVWDGNSPALYVDPYGIAPPQEIKALFPNVKYSPVQIQSYNSILCGLYAFYMLYQLLEAHLTLPQAYQGFETAAMDPKRLSHNDQLVYSFFFRQ